MLPRINSEVYYADTVPYLRHCGVVMLAKPEAYFLNLSNFLAGYADEYKFYDYLKDSCEGMSDAELLCKFAGQLCYMSLGERRTLNKDADRYFNHIKESGHFSVLEHANYTFLFYGISRSLCYAPDTDIFTAAGWKNITKLTANDTVLTLNAETKLARWSPVLSMHSFDYVGDMLSWENSRMHAPLMTPDHLLWAAKHDLRRARNKSAEENIENFAEKIPFCDVYQKQFDIQTSILMQNEHDEETLQIGSEKYLAEDIFEWLGWLSADGMFSKCRPNRCIIVQKKPENLPLIRSLMDKLFCDKWKERKCNITGLYSFAIHDKAIAKFARRNIGEKKITRKLSKWLIDASPRLLKRFIFGVIKGDGTEHKTNGHQCIYCPSYVAAGQYQVIAAKLKLPANIRIDDRVGYAHYINGKLCVNNLPNYIVDLSSGGGATVIKKHQQFSKFYCGKVFCPKTADGLIFVRNTGVPFWAGNTHELVRHRHLSFSQLSQRYVDGKVLRFVERPEYQTDEQLHKAFEERIIRFNKEYNDVAKALMEKQQAGNELLSDELKTGLRKKVNQTARSLLPNETEAPIIVTGNVRGWRHFIDLRATPGAELEIRDLAIKVLKCLKDEACLLFDDYEIVEHNDGTLIANCKFKERS